MASSSSMPSNPRKSIDAAYPQPLSQFRKKIIEPHPQQYKRTQKRKTNRHSGRYRTLPITFDEIKESDEEHMGCPSTSDAAADKIQTQDTSHHDRFRYKRNSVMEFPELVANNFELTITAPSGITTSHSLEIGKRQERKEVDRKSESSVCVDKFPDAELTSKTFHRTSL